MGGLREFEKCELYEGLFEFLKHASEHINLDSVESEELFNLYLITIDMSTDLKKRITNDLEIIAEVNENINKYKKDINLIKLLS